MDTSSQPAEGMAVGAKKGRGKKIALIIVALLILGIVVIGFLVFAGFRAVSAPINASKAWVEQTASGDTQGAYAAASQEFRNIGTLAEFEGFAESNPVFGQATDVSFNQFNIQNNEAVVSGTVSGGGETSPITIRLINEDGEWLVAAFSLRPEDVPSTSGGEEQMIDEASEEDEMMEEGLETEE